MGVWQFTYGGVTQDAAAWGIVGQKRKRKSVATDTVTFSMPGVALDAALPFAYRQPLTITRNGKPWFSGIVTTPKGVGRTSTESLDYEISGPWIYAEKTPFQQQWVTTGLAEGAFQQVTTTRSNTILGQSLDAVKMNSGQVLMEVLIYLQYAAQLIPFPTTVDVHHLPPAPATPGPFRTGLVTPNVTVPYTQLRDKSCADIIRLMLKYSPDCITAFDYSTTPPTLNIASRAALASSLGPGGSARTIQVFGTSIPTNGYMCSGFNPEPRNDLVPPVVVLKFEQNNTVDGTTYDSTTVQSYPPAPPDVDQGAWESQPFAVVQTIDLIGGNTTQQKVEVTTVARPVNEGDNVALNWFFSKEPWLKSMGSGDGYRGGSPNWDTANIRIAYLRGAIDPNDPLNSDNPNEVPLPDCHTLVNELVSGDFPQWLQTDQQLDAARVLITVYANYVGTHAATKLLFWFDPANPSVPKTDGTGYLVRYYPVRVTNADTETYSELTSWSAREPIPVGMAQSIYEALAQMHYQGTLLISELECSDLLPLGSIFNTIDGNPAWHSMNALVLSVEEDIDKGQTTVNFGPPLILDAEELEELFRSNLGRLPSYKLDQRTTGMLTAGSNVIGAKHAPESSTAHPAPTLTAVPGPNKPFQLIDASDNSGLKVKVNVNSYLQKSFSLNDLLAITGLNAAISVNVGTYVWLEIDLDNAYNPTTATINSGSGGWSGFPYPFTFTGIGPNELCTTHFVLIGYIVATSSALDGVTITGGSPSSPVTAKIVQCQTMNLLMQNCVSDGLPVVAAFPIGAPSV
jgi:hypothetical protein